MFFLICDKYTTYFEFYNRIIRVNILMFSYKYSFSVLL